MYKLFVILFSMPAAVFGHMINDLAIRYEELQNSATTSMKRYLDNLLPTYTIRILVRIHICIFTQLYYSSHMPHPSPLTPPPSQITDVGPLSSGTSVITFYIINGTNPEAPPTFIPAAVVIAAIQSRNLSQILTYPVSQCCDGKLSLATDI